MSPLFVTKKSLEQKQSLLGGKKGNMTGKRKGSLQMRLKERERKTGMK